jgi:hypothetical protein
MTARHDSMSGFVLSTEAYERFKVGRAMAAVHVGHQSSSKGTSTPPPCCVCPTK